MFPVRHLQLFREVPNAIFLWDTCFNWTLLRVLSQRQSDCVARSQAGSVNPFAPGWSISVRDLALGSPGLCSFV